MTVYEYLHKRHRPGEAETVHLTRQDGGDRTLCGRPAVGMFLGDETLMGQEATCGSCRRVYDSDAEGARP